MTRKDLQTAIIAHAVQRTGGNSNNVRRVREALLNDGTSLRGLTRSEYVREVYRALHVLDYGAESATVAFADILAGSATVRDIVL